MSDKKDNPAEQKAATDPVPAQMSGFTILQIIAWTNAEIAKCREKLEVEPSGRVVAFLQGKIPGCKFAIQSIKEIFGFSGEQFDEIEQPIDMGLLTMEQIIGAEIDMEELKENKLWGQFIRVIESKTEEMKDSLLKKAKKSRDLDESQGEYQGMTHYQKVFSVILEQVVFWKNTLFKEGDDQGTEMKDANGYPALPPPVLPDSEENYPPAEDYEDSSERSPEEETQDEDPDIDIGDPEE